MYFNKNKKYKTEKCGAKDLLCAYYPLSSSRKMYKIKRKMIYFMHKTF